MRHLWTHTQYIQENTHIRYMTNFWRDTWYAHENIWRHTMSTWEFFGDTHNTWHAFGDPHNMNTKNFGDSHNMYRNIFGDTHNFYMKFFLRHTICTWVTFGYKDHIRAIFLVIIFPDPTQLHNIIVDVEDINPHGKWTFRPSYSNKWAWCHLSPLFHSNH